MTENCWRGAVDAVRNQSGLSPEGLFRRVGRTSSKVLYAFARLRALFEGTMNRVRCEHELTKHRMTYRGSERLLLVIRFRPEPV